MLKKSIKLIFVKNIIIWRNVQWCGQWKSIYSLYELVFFDFVIDFIEEKNLFYLKSLIKRKNNNFIKMLKKQNYVTVNENIIIELKKLVFFKFFLILFLFMIIFFYLFIKRIYIFSII